MNQTVASISLGQGQGVRAEAAIESNLKTGGWVLLQNCHLASTWMPSLEKIVETINVDECDPNFRLWCTSYPSAFFPVTILQNGVKMTNEPPTGLRANLLRSYMMDPLQDPKFFSSLNDHGEVKVHMFRKISFALCFLHAILQERRNFGALGWNIPYEFNASDLAISMQQLQIFLIQQKETPWSMLTYTAGQCNYGGRVTDDTDRRLLLAILADYYTPEIGDDDYKLSESGLWYAPKDGDHQSYIDFIKGLPIEQKPEAFGLHENADISKDILNSFGLFSTALISATGGGGGGGSRDDQLLGELSKGMAERLPADFVTKLMQEKCKSLSSVREENVGEYADETHLLPSPFDTTQTPSITTSA